MLCKKNPDGKNLSNALEIKFVAWCFRSLPTVYSNGGYWVGIPNSYKCVATRETTDGAFTSFTEWEYYGKGWTLSIPPRGIVAANFTVCTESGEIVSMAQTEVGDTETVVYFVAAEREALYTISGDMLNEIAMAIQAHTGGSLMTPSAMVAALGSINSTE